MQQALTTLDRGSQGCRLLLAISAVLSLLIATEVQASFVCINRDGMGSATAAHYKNKKIPARYQYIEWRMHPELHENNDNLKGGQMLAVGYSDADGNWQTDFEKTRLDPQFATTKAHGLCADIVVPGGAIHTQVRLRPLAPEGNTNWTSWINLPGFKTGTNKTDLTYVKAPSVNEKVRGNPLANDIPIRRTLPLYATHDFFRQKDPLNNGAVNRIIEDPNDARRLVIDSAKSRNTEGLHAYISPDPEGYNQSAGQRDLAETHANLNDGGGVIVLRSMDLKYDYESCGDYLINELYPDAAWFGLNDCLGRGMYSNTKIYVAKRADVVAELASADDICASKVGTLENAFSQATLKDGGVKGGMVPGYFWSGSTTLNEQFNSAHTISQGFDSKRYSVGKSYYTNLPVWDVDDLGSSELAILLIESDDGKKNDVITCHDHINVAQIVQNHALIVDNHDFLVSQPDFKGKKITDFLGDTTAVLEFGYETNVDTYHTIQNRVIQTAVK